MMRLERQSLLSHNCQDCLDIRNVVKPKLVSRGEGASYQYLRDKGDSFCCRCLQGQHCWEDLVLINHNIMVVAHLKKQLTISLDKCMLVQDVVGLSELHTVSYISKVHSDRPAKLTDEEV